MRYFTALNIKDTNAYSSINARLVYLHMLCSMDFVTHEYTCSTRRLAMELDMSHKAVRCAIDALLIASLVRAQGGAQARAQATTYIISELANNKGTSEGTSEGTQNYNNNKNKYSLSRVREEIFRPEMGKYIASYCDLDPDTTIQLANDWLMAMTIKKREEWDSKEDAWQHLLDWCNKHKKDRKYKAL